MTAARTVKATEADYHACVCRTVDVTADNHRHLPGVDSLRCVVMTAARKVTAPARERPLALLYRRVSSRQQVELGASLDSQATVLIAECDRRGWDWRLVTERAKSVKTMHRPRLDNALAQLDRGHADILLAIRLDRVSRSVVDFGQLLGLG